MYDNDASYMPLPDALELACRMWSIQEQSPAYLLMNSILAHTAPKCATVEQHDTAKHGSEKEEGMRQRNLLVWSRLLLACALVCGWIGPGMAPTARAATLVVTTTADSGAGSLRQAVADANVTPEVDIVTFAPELANTTIHLTGTELFVTSPIIMTGPGAAQLTFSGSQVNNLFTVTTSGRLALDGLTLIDGNRAIVNAGTLTIRNSTVRGNHASNGGAIMNSGSLTISNSAFEQNTATIDGGAIYSTGALTITKSMFNNNTAAMQGGALYTQGLAVIASSVISGNMALDDATTLPTGNGGGLYNAGPLTLHDSAITNNLAGAYGGGISNHATLTVTTSIVGSNDANVAGGIYNQAPLTIEQSTLQGNHAINGGGMLNEFGPLTIASTTFNSNRANSGGAIINNSDMSMINSTISGNEATGTSGEDGGGALLQFNDDATATIRHSTIVSNTAVVSTREAIWLDSGTIWVGETILAGATDVMSGMLISEGYNLEVSPGNVLTDTTDLHTAHPLLGSLADNGGPTLTHMPLHGSPAIDAGDPAFAPPPDTDQRSLPRVLNGRIDIGAVESTPPEPPPSVSIADAAVQEGNHGTTPLTFAVALSVAEPYTVSVDYATADDAAIAGQDYTAITGTLVFAPDITHQTITVQVLGDSDVEPDETFMLMLSNPIDATLVNDRATGIIVNDDQPITTMPYEVHLPLVGKT